MNNWMVRIRKHVPKMFFFGMASLIFSFGVAGVDAIWSLYLFQFLHSDYYVGLLTGFLGVVMVITSIALIPFIERWDESRFYKWVIFVQGIIYLCFAVNHNLIMLLVLAVINVIVMDLRIIYMGIILRNGSSIKNIGRNESMVFALLNVGWLVGPLMAGFVADRMGISFVFLLAFVFCVMSFLTLAKMKIKKVPKDGNIHRNFLRNTAAFFKRWSRVSAFILGIGVAFWWGYIYVFIPLEIIRSGMSPAFVGITLFAVAMPLIMLEYEAGVLADRYGYKRFFVAGFLALVVISIILFFIKNIVIMACLLFLASFAMAFLEPLVEPFFFTCIRRKDEDLYYPTFRTCSSVGATLTRFLAAGIIFALGFRYTFLGLAAAMAFFFVIALFIDSKACRFRA